MSRMSTRNVAARKADSIFDLEEPPPHPATPSEASTSEIVAVVAQSEPAATTPEFDRPQHEDISQIPTKPSTKRKKREPVRVQSLLYADQLERMDMMCVRMRRRSGIAISRSDIIRALIDATIDQLEGKEIGVVRSEEDLREFLVRKLAQPQ